MGWPHFNQDCAGPSGGNSTHCTVPDQAYASRYLTFVKSSAQSFLAAEINPRCRRHPVVAIQSSPSNGSDRFKSFGAGNQIPVVQIPVVQIPVVECVVPSGNASPAAPQYLNFAASP